MSRNVTDLNKLKYNKTHNQWLLVNKPIFPADALKIVMTALGIDDFTVALVELEKLKERKEEKKMSPDDIYRDLALRFRIFDKFRIIRVEAGFESSTMVYSMKDSGYTPVCALVDFTSDVVDKWMQCDSPEEWDQIVSTAQMMLNPFETYKTPSDTVFDGIFNVMRPAKYIQRIILTEEPMPCAVEGVPGFALSRIPYTKVTCTLEDAFSGINGQLREFLGRVKNQEYLCAYLWRTFNGKHSPELLYLKGGGGDGKTSFVEMLGKLTRSYCSYGKEKFEVLSMYGRAIINISENRNPHLMSETLVKTITGRNLQKLEGKYKSVVPGRILGTIVVDSNHELALRGTPDEVRRLRYFKVSPHGLDASQKWDAREYIEALGSTPNEFLNYCRLCFEMLATDRGLVPPPPDHLTIISELLDQKAIYRYGKIFKKIISKGYTVEVGGFVPALEITEILFDALPEDKNPFLLDEFNSYLWTQGIEAKEGKYFNLHKQSAKEKKAIFKSIRGIKEAMPEEELN